MDSLVTRGEALINANSTNESGVIDKQLIGGWGEAFKPKAIDINTFPESPQEQHGWLFQAMGKHLNKPDINRYEHLVYILEVLTKTEHLSKDNKDKASKLLSSLPQMNRSKGKKIQIILTTLTDIARHLNDRGGSNGGDCQCF